jgi:hypothetical protein
MVTDPTTGKKLKLTGDSPPTEQELNEMFSSQVIDLAKGQKPMFESVSEGREAMRKAEDFRKQAEFEASPIGFPVTQGLAVINRAINTATFNAPEKLANLAGYTTRPITESEVARGTGEAIGFTVPTGAPMRIMRGAEIIRNPLTRNIAQGAAAMATQLPTADYSPEEYAAGVAIGGASGVLGRGIEKLAEAPKPQNPILNKESTKIR